jgi:hypothetical protein
MQRRALPVNTEKSGPGALMHGMNRATGEVVVYDSEKGPGYVAYSDSSANPTQLLTAPSNIEIDRRQLDCRDDMTSRTPSESSRREAEERP